ncbi:hypothetical protein C2E23DRAFT_181059 [Lenzites betulinus]|nr:hypothetical protein C2E23DRAFT_181059 [Lenzites betulinus]
MDRMASRGEETDWEAYDERYDAVSIAVVSDDQWDDNSVVGEPYGAAEVGTVYSLDSSIFSRSTTRATPLSRVLSTLRALRPHRPRGLASVPRALRYARYRLTRSLSNGVRSIRRHIHTPAHVRPTLVRPGYTPPPSPPPPRRFPIIPAVPIGPRPMRSNPRERRSTIECTACRAQLAAQDADAIRVPCEHLYHSECLVALVNVAMATPSQFPPSCCRRPIPTSQFLWLLTSTQRETFALLETERSTTRPLYCANPRCSRFLGARDKRVPVRILACPDRTCTTRTCARCKAAVEESTTANTHVCAHSTDHRAVVRLGTTLGWVRCPGCEQLVERNGGCPHMTCRCGTEFCYSCGKHYNGCVCHEPHPVNIIACYPPAPDERARPVYADCGLRPRAPPVPVVPQLGPVPGIVDIPVSVWTLPSVGPPWGTQPIPSAGPSRPGTPDTFDGMRIDEPYNEDVHGSGSAAWRNRHTGRRLPNLRLTIPRESLREIEQSLPSGSPRASTGRLSPISSADESQSEGHHQSVPEPTPASGSEESPTSPGPRTPADEYSDSFTAVCRRGKLAQQARGRSSLRRTDVVA